MSNVLYSLAYSTRANVAAGAAGTTTGSGGLLIDRQGNVVSITSGQLLFTPSNGGSSFYTDHVYAPLNAGFQKPHQLSRSRVLMESTYQPAVCAYYDGGGATGSWYQFSFAPVASALFKSTGGSFTAPTVTDIVGTLSTLTLASGTTYDGEIEVVPGSGNVTIYIRVYSVSGGIDTLVYEGSYVDGSPLSVGVGMFLANTNPTYALDVTLSDGAATGTAYSTVAGTGTSTSDPYILMIPAELSNATSAPVIVFSHGSGGNRFQIQTFPDFEQSVMNAGYRLLSGDFTGEHWGNTAAQTAFSDDASTVAATYVTSCVLVYGVSMGGLLSNLMMENATVPATVGGKPWTAHALCCPVCDLVWTYNSNAGVFAANINAAYGITGVGQIPSSHNPLPLMQGNAALQHSIPVLPTYDTGDPYITPADNILPLITAMTQGPVKSSVTTSTGTHVPYSLLSGAPLAGVMAFFAANLAIPPTAPTLNSSAELYDSSIVPLSVGSSGFTDVHGGIYAVSGSNIIGTPDTTDIFQFERDFAVRPTDEDVENGEIVVTTTPGGIQANSQYGSMLRYTNTSNWYNVYWLTGTGMVILRNIAGSITSPGVIAFTTAINYAHSYKTYVRIETKALPSSTVTIFASVYDVTAGAWVGGGSFVDASTPLTGAGQMGVVVWTQNTSGSTTTTFSAIQTYSPGNRFRVKPGSSFLSLGSPIQLSTNASDIGYTGIIYSTSSGSVTSVGLYTPPNAAGTYTVTATATLPYAATVTATIKVLPDPSMITTVQGTAYVRTTGNDSTGVVNNPALPFLTIDAALDHVKSGSTINIGPGRFHAISSFYSYSGWTATNKLKDGITFQGASMCSPNAALTAMDETTGTCIEGPLIPYNNNLTFSDLSIDSGYTVCATYNSGNGVEGLESANVYNGSSILGDETVAGDATNSSYLYHPARQNVVYERVSVLSSEHQVHCMILEDVEDSSATDCIGVLGFAGLVMKAVNSTANRITLLGNGVSPNYGLILKSNDYAECYNIAASNIQIGPYAGTGGGSQSGLAGEINVLCNDTLPISGVVLTTATVAGTASGTPTEAVQIGSYSGGPVAPAGFNLFGTAIITDRANLLTNGAAPGDDITVPFNAASISGTAGGTISPYPSYVVVPPPVIPVGAIQTLSLDLSLSLSL